MSYPFPEEEITITRGELERLIEAGFNRGFVKECDRNEGSARSVGMSMLNKAISGGFASDDFAKFAAQFESNS